MPAYTLVVEDRFGSLIEEYTFESGRLVIGRSRECDIVLPSENVSRQHASVYTKAGALFIEDMGSSNGIHVNGTRVEGPAELTELTVVRLGDFHVHVKGAGMAQVEKTVHVRLVGRNLTVADEVFELSETTTLVGRGRDSGITMVDPSVSRVHGRIMVKPDGSVLVEDVGSANGVFVNDRRVKIWQLKEGDVLRFGNVEFLVEIPTADTVETMAGGGPLIGRIRHAVSSNLPWTIASLCALMVVILLVVFLPDYIDRRAVQPAPAPAPATPASAPAETTPKPAPRPKIDSAAVLIDARTKLESKDLDGAQAQAERVIASNPTDAEAVKLLNRIELERRAEKSLAASMEAMAKKDYPAAAQALLQVPGDSMIHAQCVAQLDEIEALIDRDRRRRCRRKGKKSVDCIRLTALVGKIAEAVKPPETAPQPRPAGP